jgi:hypothetical protein
MYFVVFGILMACFWAALVWFYDRDAFVFFGWSAFMAAGFIVILIIGAMSAIDNQTFPQKFEATRQSVEYALSNGEGFADMALMDEVIDANKKLAHMQYWNEKWLCDCLYPDEVMDLEPIG